MVNQIMLRERKEKNLDYSMELLMTMEQGRIRTSQTGIGTGNPEYTGFCTESRLQRLCELFGV